MTAKIDFYYDFGSPNCYLAYKALGDFVDPASVEIKPCLIGGIFKATNNQAPWAAFSGVKGKLQYEMLEIERFVKKHKLGAYKLNPNFPINTLTLMRAFVALEDRQTDYLEAVNKAMWEDGRNLNDMDETKAVFDEAGFDGAALLASTQDAEVKARLAEVTSEAVARGVFGLPTFFVGDEMFFGKDRLDQVAEAAGA